MGDSNELMKLVNTAADFLNRLAGPMADEFGAILGDKVRVYRAKNLVATMQKTERILKDAGLSPDVVAPRLLLPIVENSSIEDNESLQDLWAGLLATSTQETNSVSPSFIETLKQLTPDEARYLDEIAKEVIKEHRLKPKGAQLALSRFAFTDRGGAPPGVSCDTYERLGLIRRDFQTWVHASTNEDGVVDDVDSSTGYRFILTRYSLKFLAACRGPRPTHSEK